MGRVFLRQNFKVDFFLKKIYMDFSIEKICEEISLYF